MPQLTIDGVHVDFPYEPYACQVTYMTDVIKCLRNVRAADLSSSMIGAYLQKCHGALESPTGTGKTLCLLCATLGWLMHVRGAQQGGVHRGDGDVAGGGMGALDLMLYPQRIFYASRTHSQLSQVVRELNKTMYARRVRVCVLGSRDQLCVNEHVQKMTSSNAKNQMCRQLVAVHKCRFYNEYEKSELLLSAATNNVYIARKNGDASSIAQVMCSDDVAAKAADIEDVVSHARRNHTCPYYSTRDNLEHADLILLPYNYILDPSVRAANKLRLANSIVLFDEAHNLLSFCEQAASVSISARDIAGAIREAQTVLKIIQTETESVRAHMDTSTAAFGSVTDGERVSHDIDEQDLSVLTAKLFRLDAKLSEIKLRSDDGTAVLGRYVEHCPNGRALDAQYLIDLLTDCEIEPHLRDATNALVDKCAAHLSEKPGQQASAAFHSNGVSLLKFATLLNTVFMNSDDPIEAKKDLRHFVVYVTDEDPRKYGDEDADSAQTSLSTRNLTLNYWCFSASVGMRFLLSHPDHRASTIICTSGTLAPIRYYCYELGIPFSSILSNVHVIQPEQVWFGACCVGPDTTPLDGTYRSRKNPLYMSALGNTLLNAMRVCPQGMLVFFSSYTHMQACVDHWRTSRILEQMNARKTVVVEPRGKQDFITVMKQFDDCVTAVDLATAQRGAALFAVCRGKASEGIDFSDASARLVVLVGIPYPPMNDARVSLKKEYLMRRVQAARAEAAAAAHVKLTSTVRLDTPVDQHLTADDWYQLEAVRAVNQSIGRAIRHSTDYGAVLLADVRYSKWQRVKFPAWIRARMLVFPQFGLVLGVFCL